MLRPAWTLAAVLLAVTAAQAQGRVVLIGVDGLDEALCREYIAANKLPTLAALAQSGGFVPLKPTNPAISPVSWSTIFTGLNPGVTGVNDFLRREFRNGDVAADYALAERSELLGPGVRTGLAAIGTLLTVIMAGAAARRRGVAAGVRAAIALGLAVGTWQALSLSVVVPRATRGGEALHERADRAGLPATSLFAPTAFPAPRLATGHLLCGLGVSDAMGTPGTVTVNREEPVAGGGIVTATGCRVRPWGPDAAGRLHGAVDGPLTPGARTRASVPFDFTPDRAHRAGVLRLGAAEARLTEGTWSPYIEAPFQVGPFTVNALARFRLVEGGARTVLYQEPASFDPRSPMALAPIASPAAFAAEMAADGLYTTLGWPEATNPLQDEVIDEDTFLAQIADLDAQRSKMVLRALKRGDWRLFSAVLSSPDRVQHLFWRDREASHPRHDAAAMARRGDPILESYQRVDRLLAVIQREVLHPGDLLLVASDHGFAPFNTAVNLNRLLAEHGYLVGRGTGIEQNIETTLGTGRGLFPNVDWTRTRAYSIGLGKVYINTVGDSPVGIVARDDRRALMEAIRADLMALRDGDRRVVHSVSFREDIYHGARVNESADLIIGFERGYRVSWQTCLGGMDEPVLAPNRNLWSGDHCSVDPELVPGVLFASRPINATSAHVADIFPTITTALGLPTTPGLDGHAVPLGAAR